MISLEENCKKLKQISQLEKNWNGYGADIIPYASIFNAQKIIDACILQPFLSPVADGSVQLEWENKEKEIYLEIQCYSNYYKIFLQFFQKNCYNFEKVLSYKDVICFIRLFQKITGD